MTLKCYVPVLPFVEGGRVTGLYGYDPKAVMPYIIETTLEEFGTMQPANFGGVRGMVYFDNVMVHPFALYPCEAAARVLIDDFIVVRTAK